jgi:hypothetical protein
MKSLVLFVAAAIGLAAFGPGERLVSPNREYVLIGSDREPQLWLDEVRTHQRRKVMDVTLQTMMVSWSPDSSAFAVSDRDVSDRELAYIYDVKTLERLEIRPRILAAYPETDQFVPGPDRAPHSYCHVMRWLDPQHVEVRLYGHTDGVRVGTTWHVGDCFDLRFRVSREGEVKELSRRVLPLTEKACETIG